MIVIAKKNRAPDYINLTIYVIRCSILGYYYISSTDTCMKYFRKIIEGIYTRRLVTAYEVCSPEHKIYIIIYITDLKLQ